MRAERIIALNPGESEEVLFDFTPLEVRHFKITVNGLEGILKVIAPGYMIYDFPAMGKIITTAIWYPSDDKASIYTYNRRVSVGQVALNGNICHLRGPYPLILFSHGFWGCGTQSVYICQYLAQHGYIIAAPDHQDASWCTIKGGLRRNPPQDIEPKLENPFVNSPDRPLDIKAVIDEMIRLNRNPASPFYGSILEDRIAVSGHSLGGWTSMVLSGAAPWPYKYFEEQRIKACLILAGVVDPKMASEKVNIPQMYIYGVFDQGSPGTLPRRTIYDNSVGLPKFLGILRDAGHFIFADTTCIPYENIQTCQIADPRVKTTLKYASAFLDRYLKNDFGAEVILCAGDPMFFDYEYEF